MNESMLCTKTHEYVLEQGDTYEVGITDYAIEQLGDIVFIELPEVGATFSKNEAFATIESVKAASEIYENKWFVKIKSDANQVEFADLMDYSDYKEEIE